MGAATQVAFLRVKDPNMRAPGGLVGGLRSQLLIIKVAGPLQCLLLCIMSCCEILVALFWPQCCERRAGGAGGRLLSTCPAHTGGLPVQAHGLDVPGTGRRGAMLLWILALRADSWCMHTPLSIRFMACSTNPYAMLHMADACNHPPHPSCLRTSQGLQYSGCAWPDRDPRGPWCAYEPGSCNTTLTPASSTYDFCVVQTTLAGCKCANKFVYKNVNYYGQCVNPDDDPLGSWCAVDETTCPSVYRAHLMGGTASTWDYCQTTTQVGMCLNMFACIVAVLWAFALPDVTYCAAG